MDAAQRNEILSRYEEHRARFESVAARRDANVAEVIPFQTALPELEQEPTAREIEVLQLDLRRSREPRDRRSALPLRRDGQEPRQTPAREASGAQQSPRRSGWLPAWAH